MKAAGCSAVALATILTFGSIAVAQQPTGVKIGIISDFSSVYSDIGGQGNVEAAKMAVEDFKGTILGKPIEIITADAQNKADIAAALARAAGHLLNLINRKRDVGRTSSVTIAA